MDYNDKQNKLYDYTRKLSDNIYKFHISLKMEEIISHYYEEINTSKYRSFFSFIQLQCIDQLLLSLSKVYDRNSVSLDSIINFIESNRNELPGLGFNPESHIFLDFDFNKYKETVVEKMENGQKVFTRINDRFVQDLVKKLKIDNEKNKKNFESQLESLKNIRDTQIAHTDKKVIEGFGVSWEDIDKISKYPQNVLALIEDVFLATSTSYTKHEYLHMFKMLQELKIIDNKLTYYDVF